VVLDYHEVLYVGFLHYILCVFIYIWRKLHSEELLNLFSSPDIIRQIKSRQMRWAGHVAHMGEERKVYKDLVGKPEGKRPLGRPRRRWEDGIRMDIREIGLGGGVDWIRLAQDRDQWQAVVNVMMNPRGLAHIMMATRPDRDLQQTRQQGNVFIVLIVKVADVI
jgi:hypothetical protein